MNTEITGNLMSDDVLLRGKIIRQYKESMAHRNENSVQSTEDTARLRILFNTVITNDPSTVYVVIDDKAAGKTVYFGADGILYEGTPPVNAKTKNFRIEPPTQNDLSRQY